jgi:hypothetical protein
MTTIHHNRWTATTSNTRPGTDGPKVERADEYTVISDGGLAMLTADALIDFARTLQDLNADQPGIRDWHVHIDRDADRGCYSIRASWKRPLPNDQETP